LSLVANNEKVGATDDKAEVGANGKKKKSWKPQGSNVVPTLSEVKIKPEGSEKSGGPRESSVRQLASMPAGISGVATASKAPSPASSQPAPTAAPVSFATQPKQQQQQSVWCPSCKQEYTADMTFCIQCGGKCEPRSKGSDAAQSLVSAAAGKDEESDSEQEF